MAATASLPRLRGRDREGANVNVFARSPLPNPPPQAGKGAHRVRRSRRFHLTELCSKFLRGSAGDARGPRANDQAGGSRRGYPRGLRRGRQAVGPDQQFLAGAGAPAGGAQGLDAAQCIDPARQRQVGSRLRQDPTARHHQDVGAQRQRLLHVAQRAARQKARIEPGAGRSGARRRLHELERSR